MEIEGSKMYLDPNAKGAMRVALQSYIQFSGKERITTELFRQSIKQGDVVVDLGANIGYFALLASRLIGNEGKVYSFEPEPNNYNLMVKNIELNDYKNIVSEQMAVSNINGISKFYIANAEVGAHTLREHHANSYFMSNEGGDYINTPTITLDEYFRNKKLPDFIKMDIEGAEMLALMGMDKIIQTNKDLKIISEFYPSAMREMGCSPIDFLRTLKNKYGFSIMAIDELRNPSNQCLKVTPEELMALCNGKDKIFNLYLER
jgi:FkbM family methyltransferase